MAKANAALPALAAPRHMGAAFKTAFEGRVPKDGPLISIIVPAYNDEDFVRRAVGSCLSQTYGRIEVVCVDDGSTDGTFAVLQGLAGADARVKVTALERNEGPHNARRAGLALATGELVTFLDADDELTGDACARIAAEHARERFDILHFASRIRRDGKATVQQALDMAAWTTPISGELEGREILTRTFVDGDYAFNVACKAYRADLAKRAFEALGPRESDFGEDALEYFAIAFFAKGYRGIPHRRLYVYHLGDGLSARRDLSAADFARTLRGIRSIEGMRAFLESQGALETHADIYEAHRAGQLGALLRSWSHDVRESDRDEVLRQILKLWPRDEVIDGMCALGAQAVEAVRRCSDEEVVLSEEQVYRCGVADGEAATRDEFESSVAYRVGRIATAAPRRLKSHLMR